MTYSKAKQDSLALLSFNDARHRYSWEGLLIPNVTTVIDSQIGFYGVPKEKMEEARVRGHEVHRLTALADEIDQDGGKDSLFVSTLYNRYLDSWWKFLDENDCEILEIEQRVFHRRHLYAGTLDRVVRLDGVLTILDIKTGLAYPEYAWQTAAYLEAANDGRTGEKIQNRLAVQLKDDGTYVPHPHTDRNDFGVFLAALTIYQWRGAHNR